MDVKIVSLLVSVGYVFLLDMQIYLQEKKKDPEAKYDWAKVLVRTGLMALTMFAATNNIALPN